MSPAENKRAKRRKNKKVRSESKSAIGTEAHPNIPLDFMNSTLDNRVVDNVGEAQATELPSASGHELRCMVCNSEPPKDNIEMGDRGSADGCEEGKGNVQASLNIFSQVQLPWYICSNCKTAQDAIMYPEGSSVYVPPMPFVPFVTKTGEAVESELCSCKACFDQTCFSELTGTSAGTLACSLGLNISASVGGVPSIPPHLQRENSKEEELKGDWQELKQVLHQTYREAGLTLGEALTPHLSSLAQNTTLPSDQRVKEIVCKLCRQDAHKLYLCLESQVKLFVVEMRLRLLMQVGEASSTTNSGKPFVCFLLEEYAKLCSAAARLAPYFEELESTHLKNFKLTWELVNRHLFQSIVYNDPLLHSRHTMNFPQHRVGSSNGNMCGSGHDSFYAVTKFDDEMTVLSVLWREAEQLIDDYNQGQAALAKQGLELLHAQMKQMMEEELNLSLFQRYPSHECQKSCSHAGLVKNRCTKGSPAPSYFLSPLELVTLAEQADNHVLSLAAATLPSVPPPRHLGIADGASASSLGLLAGVWPPTCIKTSPYYAKMPQQAKLFPDITSGFNFLKESYQQPRLDCFLPENDGNPSSPFPTPLPQLPPLATSLSVGETLNSGSCCMLQHNGNSKQPGSPSKHSLDQHVQTTKTNCSLKGGGSGSHNRTGHTAESSSNSGPESKGGCECHSCNQQPKRGRDQTTDLHANYEAGLKLRDLSPNLLTGLKSMFAEACGSPSALAAVKQLIHPHLYKLHSNNTNPSNQRSNKASGPSQANSSVYPEPFDLKLEAQGILREQIKLAAIGDWDCDADEARSLFLHHYHNAVKNQRASSSPQFDLPSFPQPPSTPLLIPYFPPISLDEVSGRNNLPDMCQACKVEPEARTEEGGVTGVINNLSQTTRKTSCGHGKTPRELNGLLPDGYGSVDCSVLNGRHLQTSNLPATPPDSNVSSASSTPATTPSSAGGSLTACTAAGGNSSSSSLSSMGVAERGIPGHGCCEGHGPDGGDESGPDDSCSEKSSSTSTSNQRESRVCDCCYCEVFGHGVPVVAPVSRNYPEMRDRLRLRLSKRKAEGSGSGASNGGGIIAGVGGGAITLNCEKNDVPLEDSRELDELLKFINGTEEEKNKQRKAKRKGSKKGEVTREEEVLLPPPQEPVFVERKVTEQPPKQPQAPVMHTFNNQKVVSLVSESQRSPVPGRQPVAKSTKQQQNVTSQENSSKGAPKGVKQRLTPTTHILQANSSSKKPSLPEKIVNGNAMAKAPALERPMDGVHLCKPVTPSPQVRVEQDALPEAEKTNTGHHHMNGSLTAKEIVSTCSEGKSSARGKKSKKKKNGGDDGASPDDVFMPKDIDLENGEMDEFEKELEAFKRFCFNSVPLANKEKVHVNLKDIVVKKKASNGVAVSNGHKF